MLRGWGGRGGGRVRIRLEMDGLKRMTGEVIYLRVTGKQVYI